MALTEEDSELRKISAILTAMGHPMNHTTVRNKIVGVMAKFATAFKVTKIGNVDSPEFINTIGQMLELIENDRRRRK